MRGFIENLEKLTVENNDFRRVLYTARNSQLVLMSILPGEDIGEEIHELDQFLRIEEGDGLAILDGAKHKIASGTGIVVPSGMKHNIINTGTKALKLYSVYSPPEHQDGIVRQTKVLAVELSEHFDGKTTE